MNQTEIPKLIIFDFWQTLANLEVGLFSEILKIIDSDLTIQEFSEKIRNSPVYLTDNPIQETLPFLLREYTHDQKRITLILNLWLEAPKQAFIIRGVLELLERLTENKIILCLMSNVDKYGFENFPHQKVYSYFNYLFVSFKEGIAKPDLRCWEKIENVFKIKKSNILMVGDNLREDIEPAKKFGIKTALISDKQVDNNSADYIFSSIYEFSQFILTKG